jgi:transposase-like protein
MMSTMPRSRSYSDEVRAKVAEMYQSGKKWAEIEEETGLTRGTIGMLLQQAGVMPSRMKTKSRLEKGDPQATVEWAFKTLMEQERTIARLEDELEDCKRKLARAQQRLKAGG